MAKKTNILHFSRWALIWLGLFLGFCGFGIYLGGVAALQQSCSTAPLETAGTVGYLVPVNCGKFYRYPWWILWLHFFTWCVIVLYTLLGVLSRGRTASIGLLAVTSVLLMDTANTFLYYNDLEGVTGKNSSRAKALTAGAIISAVADMYLILVIGFQPESVGEERGGAGSYETPRTTAAPAGGQPPVSTTV